MRLNRLCASLHEEKQIFSRENNLPVNKCNMQEITGNDKKLNEVWRLLKSVPYTQKEK